MDILDSDTETEIDQEELEAVIMNDEENSIFGKKFNEDIDADLNDSKYGKIHEIAEEENEGAGED